MKSKKTDLSDFGDGLYHSCHYRGLSKIDMFLDLIHVSHLLLSCFFVCVGCSVVSDSLQLHGLEPARLLCPWNSPGKNTGVGCHFLLRCLLYLFLNPWSQKFAVQLSTTMDTYLGIKYEVDKAMRACSVAQLCPILCNPMDCSPWYFPGKNTGVGCHFILRGIFLTQGLNPRLLALAGGFFITEPPGKPKVIQG